MRTFRLRRIISLGVFVIYPQPSSSFLSEFPFLGDEFPEEATTPSGCSKGCFSKQILDAFTRLYDEQEFDSSIWLRFRQCLEKASSADLDMVLASDAAWKGFVDYGRAEGGLLPNGTLDEWGSHRGKWLEWDPVPLSQDSNTIPGAEKVIIGEPCNTVSNVPYFLAMIDICDRDIEDWAISHENVVAMLRSFASLYFGSVFWHASQTALGGSLDLIAMDHVASVALQGALEPLPYSPITHDLSETRRSQSAAESIADLNTLFLETDVFGWLERLDSVSPPGYAVSFSALTIAITHLILPSVLASPIFDFLLPLVTVEDALTPEDAAFLAEQFEPTILQAYVNRKSLSLSAKWEAHCQTR